MAITVMAAALGATSLPAQQAEPTGPQPMVEIPKMKHDFGDVFEQEKYEFTFTVRNRGKADLVIENVNPG